MTARIEIWEYGSDESGSPLYQELVYVSENNTVSMDYNVASMLLKEAGYRYVKPGV